MKPKLLRAVALIAAILVSYSVIQAQTLSDNKKIILRSESELWSKGDLAVADQLYSTGFVCHFVLGPEWKGVPGIRNAVSSHRTSFPDWKEKVEDIVAEGDRVAIRISSSGTQRGEFAGIPPTGRKVTIEEFHIYRIADGKIVEQWGMPDVQGLMRQLTTPSTDNSPK